MLGLKLIHIIKRRYWSAWGFTQSGHLPQPSPQLVWDHLNFYSYIHRTLNWYPEFVGGESINREKYAIIVGYNVLNNTFIRQ